jgi:D-alanyl-D-alanine carboxypeptidase
MLAGDAETIAMINRTSFARVAFQLLMLCSCVLPPHNTAQAAEAESMRTQLPDTSVGRLATTLIQRINSSKSTDIKQWAPTVLSAAVTREDRDMFISALASAAADSGGLDISKVQSDPRQPGLLFVEVKARRDGRQALFVLATDTEHPDKLAQAGLYPMTDPQIYANWPRTAVTDTELAVLIRTAMDGLVKTEDFSGCVTVQNAGRILFNECRGMAERNFSVPLNEQTRFHIGSINKSFTAVAIAQLIEAGKLSWHDTLAKLVPDYPDQTVAAKITVWQLLHHTSGLGDFLVPDYFEHSERYINPSDYLELIARQPLVSEPGKQWIYSNAGYMLLGRIIENTSGQNYFDYIQQHIFAPTKMTSSGFDGLDEAVPMLATGYHRDGLFSPTWKAAWLKLGYKGGPAGGGYSTNADLLRFASALREGKLLKPATMTTMFDKQIPAGPGSYAAGFGERLSHGRRIRGHSGGIEGTTANLQMVWETGAAVALTSNQGPTENWMLAERIADLLAAKRTKD